jgi:hypothetical protein
MGTKLTIEDMNSILSASDVKCLADRARGIYAIYNFSCSKGHEFKAFFNDVQKMVKRQLSPCPVCRPEIREAKEADEESWERRQMDEKHITPIQKCKIVEKYLVKDRWHVKLDPPYCGQAKFFHAHYVWLLANPAFYDIPLGYEVHHLDGDRQNDDISNLVIMLKTHHAAHHSKQKTPKTKVSIRPGFSRGGSTLHFPYREPCIFRGRTRSDGSETYFVRFWEKVAGRRKAVSIHTWEGRTIIGREMAEKVKNLIWKTSEPSDDA